MHLHLLLPFLAILLSQCSQPVDFKRDNPLDPQSDSYSPAQPKNLRMSFSTDNHIGLAWQVVDSVFDSILIEKKTILDTDFVRLAAVAKNVTHYVDTAGMVTDSVSYRVASLYRRDRKEFKSYSNTVKIFPDLAWSNHEWDGIPMSLNIRHFSEYDDLYLMDDGVYDYNTHQKLFDVPRLVSGSPNGFTNKGGLVAQIGAPNTTLRHYTSDGNHSGDIIIPATSHIIGQVDDVLYFNPTRRTLERIHLPTKTTTVIEAGLPNVTSASFAIFENNIAMKIQNQMHIYRFSETEGYALLNSFAIPSHISEQREMRMTDTHVIIRLRNGLWNYFWYIDRESGSLESLSQHWTTISQYAYLDGYEWLVYFGRDAYFVDLNKSTQFRVVFYPESTAFSALNLHRVRFHSDQPEILILRSSSTSSQLVKLTKQYVWVTE